MQPTTSLIPPVVNGKGQNYYKFKRSSTFGVYLLSIEFKGAWGSSIDEALRQLEGHGWELVTIDKYEQI